MAYFPLCINLDGANVILLGDGQEAHTKRDILLSFGANIRVFSEKEDSRWEEDPAVELVHRSFQQSDLEPRPALVVVAEVPWAEKERVSQLCRNRGVPVNVVDVPDLCSFYFPSLVTKGCLTVAVSTAGKSPGGAAWLRRHLENHIPEQTGEILEWSYSLRQWLCTEYPEADRRAILRSALSQALTENRLLTEEEIQTILQRHKDNG